MFLQYFELVKQIYVPTNCYALLRVKAFLDGRVIAEATPSRLTGSAYRILNATLDKYAIPYETETQTETRKLHQYSSKC